MPILIVDPAGPSPPNYPTINAALAAAVGGDIIEIVPGTYVESVHVNAWALAPGLTIRGQSGNRDDVIIDQSATANYALRISTPTQLVTIQDLTAIGPAFNHGIHVAVTIDNLVTLSNVRGANYNLNTFNLTEVSNGQAPGPGVYAAVYINAVGGAAGAILTLNRVLADIIPDNSHSCAFFYRWAPISTFNDCAGRGGNHGLVVTGTGNATIRRFASYHSEAPGIVNVGGENVSFLNCIVSDAPIAAALMRSGFWNTNCNGTTFRNCILDAGGIVFSVDSFVAAAWAATPWMLETYNTLRKGSGIFATWAATQYLTLASWQAGGAPGNGDNSDAADPLFWNPNLTTNPDFHLKSKVGRWDPTALTWVPDLDHSPAIDAGDPTDPVGLELTGYNGGRINRGIHGGTVEASLSSGYDIVWVAASQGITDPCSEEVTWGTRRWGSFVFGATETFAFCEKILTRLPPYTIINTLMHQLVGGISKQFEMHWDDIQAMPTDWLTQRGIHDVAEDWGMLLAGDESVPEVQALLEKRNTILGARGTVGTNADQSGIPAADWLDVDSGMVNEVDRLCKSKYLNANGVLVGETRVTELGANDVGWFLTERKSTAELTYPHVNIYGVFSKDSCVTILGVNNGLLFLRARNRNVARWSSTALEAAIRRQLVPADVEAVITILEAI